VHSSVLRQILIFLGLSSSVGLVLIGQRLPRGYGNYTQTQTHPWVLPSVSAPPMVGSSNSPRLLKFNLLVSSPKNLKVKQGDIVTVGEVLAEQVEERSRLTTQRQDLELSFKQIQTRMVTIPPTPVSVPEIKSLPPISYVEEEAAIHATAMNVQQTEKALQLQQENLKTEPLEESSALASAAIEVQNRQRLLEKQQRKIDVVATLKELPPSVSVHEQEVLKQRSAELQQAQVEYQKAQAKLSGRKASETEKLSNLSASVQKAKADHQLAIAKLQTKKDQRAYTEYEASVTAARTAEEKNQAAQNYYRQMLEAEQQQRDRWFQLAQIQTKIAEVDKQLSSLSVIASPYNGVVQRLEIQDRTNNDLTIEITLAVASIPTAVPSPSSDNFVLTPASRRPGELPRVLFPRVNASTESN